MIGSQMLLSTMPGCRLFSVFLVSCSLCALYTVNWTLNNCSLFTVRYPLAPRDVLTEQQTLNVSHDDVTANHRSADGSLQLSSSNYSRARSQRRLNVIFIIADDMRPQLGCYSNEDAVTSVRNLRMFTPNIDAIATRSLLLTRYYAQFSLCGPSRASMLTGRRPDSLKIYSNREFWRHKSTNATTLPQYFKQQGYATYGMGKIYHQGPTSDHQDSLSWSGSPYFPLFVDIQLYPLLDAGYKSVTEEERQNVSLIDDLVFEEFKVKLDKVAPRARSGEQPFFLAFGFTRPHLNLICPEKFMNMYELEKGDQYLVDKDWQRPKIKRWFHVVNSTMDPDGNMRVTDQGLRHFRRAYAACISHVDDIVGAMMDELDRHDLTDSTIIVVTADHGIHMGENGHFGKGTADEVSTRIPLILHIPGHTERGIVSRTPAEAVDLFQTLVSAAGLPAVPACPPSSHTSPPQLCTEGQSLIPLIRDPDATLTEGALSQTQCGPNCTRYSIRTTQYRLTMCALISQDSITLERHHRKGDPQLYDFATDPHEMINHFHDHQYEEVRDAITSRLVSKLTKTGNKVDIR